MEPKRICKSICKRYIAKKPASGGRYGTGQGRCQTCDVWIDYHGAHMKDGSPAKVNTVGWFCNCCNFRIRQNPRNKIYKENLRTIKSLSGEQPHANGQDPHENDRQIDRLNHLITEALCLIKSNPSGTYMEDLRILLDISTEEISGLAVRVKRIDGVNMMQTYRDGEPFDFFFTFNESEDEISESTRLTHGQLAETEHASSNTVSEDLKVLAQRCIDDHSANHTVIEKHLQRILTKEFLEVRSIKGVIANHPDLVKDKIKCHIRTPIRLPNKLRTRNEEGLHPDPELSLQIALFAVNYHDWDGQKGTEDDVIRMAESIACYISSDGKAGQSVKKPQQDKYNNKGQSVSTAIAVWIATATLHQEHGIDAIFSNQDIMVKTMEQRLCNVSYNTISAHISCHCVANAPTTTSVDHRNIYRVRSGTYRLYKRGEPYHPARKSGTIAPLPFQLPDGYKDLRKWYDNVYCKL